MSNNTAFLQFLERQQIAPKRIEYYIQSITHPSFSNERKSEKSYQRLEFLGDAILEAATAEYVFILCPEMNEGEMTILRSKAVSGNVIASFAKEIGLDEHIRFGNKSGDLRNSEKILADIFEAFVAAIYLDLGKEATVKFLDKNVFKFVRDSKNEDLKNPKTILQELLQSYSREAIEYRTVEYQGGFEATVYHDGHAFGSGKGPTKKEAEVKAAENSLKLLKK